MSNIKPGEIRYFEWGNEPAGYVSTWTVNEDRSVRNLGGIPRQEAWEKKFVYECPYP